MSDVITTQDMKPQCVLHAQSWHLNQAMDNLHVRLNFNLSKEKGIKHNS